MIKIEALAIAAAIALAVGFGAGWTVNGWRLSGDVARLEGTVDTQKQSIETFDGANKRCTAGLDDVKKSVRGMADAAAARDKAAAEAMARAEKAAGEHLAAAKDALSRPLPVPGKECESVAAEAAKYAKKRKDAP